MSGGSSSITWIAKTLSSGNWLARTLGGRRRTHAYRSPRHAVRWRMRAPGWYQQIGTTGRWFVQHGRPEIVLPITNAAIPRRPHQSIHSDRPFSRKQFIHIAFAIPDTGQLGLRTAWLQRQQVRQAFDPRDAFLLVNRTGLALRGASQGRLGARPRLKARHPRAAGPLGSPPAGCAS
jgi:hypothetical protein